MLPPAPTFPAVSQKQLAILNIYIPKFILLQPLMTLCLKSLAEFGSEILKARGAGTGGGADVRKGSALQQKRHTEPCRLFRSPMDVCFQASKWAGSRTGFQTRPISRPTESFWQN